VANPRIGLAYGKVPRMVLVYLTTEAVRTSSPRIDLGRSLSAFLEALQMGQATGGKNGTGTRIREQLKRLLTTTVSASIDTIEATGRKGFQDIGCRLSEGIELCWHPRQNEQIGLWGSHVDLTPKFYDMVRDRPVPVDRRALRGLRSSLALDLYVWLTYRMSYLEQEREIPWPLLEKQFGANYGSTKSFRRNVLRHLREVLTVYPEARVTVKPRGLLLKPSRPHVAKVGSGSNHYPKVRGRA
jgi:hypothetical protein